MQSIDLQNSQKDMVIYQADDGSVTVDVRVAGETIWLSLNQMATLFNRDKSVISRHLKNIFLESELEHSATVANFATVQKEGERLIERQVEFYNLDAILSVGYRVNSKQGTLFRKWATQVLKDYMVRGFVLNQKKLDQQCITDIQHTLQLLSHTLINQGLVNDLGTQALQIIQVYAKTWHVLLQYDEDRLTLPSIEQNHVVFLEYEEALHAIAALKENLIQKGEATALFGQERGDSLCALLGNLKQTFDGTLLYESATSRAAHLCYFVIKNHPFTDGNKRIGCLLFLLYLKKSGIDLACLNHNGLIALALLIAESHPSQKTMMIKLISTLISEVGSI